MKETIIRLEPNLHPQQLEVFNCPSRFRIVMAGRRFGKTRLGLWEMIIHALRNPRSLIWYIAPTYRQAKMIAWRQLVSMIPIEARKKVNESELTVETITNSHIELKGADNEDSLRGQGPDLVIYDEVAFIKQHIHEEIIRPSLIDKKGRALFLGTPSGKNWFWKLYQEAELGIDKSYSAFRFTTFDNPYLPVEELEIAKRQTKNSLIYKQEYLAEPQTQEGLVYPEFTKEVHIVAPFEMPKDARYFRAIDWGIHAPCVCLWAALLPSGEIFITREHYKNGLPPSKQAEIIKGKTIETVESTVIDPSTDKRDNTNLSNSVRMEFIRNGISAHPGDNRVGFGISIVKEYLELNKLMIFENCENLILEFLTYEWAQAQQENVFKEKPKDGGDDGLDALRYLIVFLSGRSRKYGLDSPKRNGTLAQDKFLVTYENDEITQIRHRKVPPWEKQEGSFTFDDYGGFLNA